MQCSRSLVDSCGIPRLDFSGKEPGTVCACVKKPQIINFMGDSLPLCICAMHVGEIELDIAYAELTSIS